MPTNQKLDNQTNTTHTCGIRRLKPSSSELPAAQSGAAQREGGPVGVLVVVMGVVVVVLIVDVGGEQRLEGGDLGLGVC